MTTEQVIFFILATITVVAALGMVSVASVFHAALLMILAFTGIAALYMLLGAGFLGIIQILIYVGAIAVLMLFAIMLTPRMMRQGNQSRFTQQWPLAAILASGLVVLLVPQFLGVSWPLADVGPGERDFALDIGKGFMNAEADGFLLPFE
ncbi:MAG: NADH-quinone oxidoreductase subunit J, partial [Ardenticatenales bacterium]|nr:NADH-quinone oxidoreductase subunit J [Ardenticatenales bacterium]